MSAPTLRPYQVAAIQGVRKAMDAGARAPLLVLPTGGGKTVVTGQWRDILAAAR